MVYKLFLHPPAPAASTGWQPQLRVRGCSSPIWLQAGSENRGERREGSRSQQRPALGCPLESRCHQDTLVGKPAQPSMNCLGSIKGRFHPPSARSLSQGWHLLGGSWGWEMLSELLRVVKSGERPGGSPGPGLWDDRWHILPLFAVGGGLGRR